MLYEVGDLLKFKDKWLSVYEMEDVWEYGILINKSFVFDKTNCPNWGDGIRVDEYTVYNFSTGGKYLIDTSKYDIERVGKK